MELKKVLIIGIMLFGILAIFPVHCEEKAQKYLPESFEFSKNFYTVYGTPDITATLQGENEFERNETATLFVDLMNRGKVLGFKSERDLSPSDQDYANEIKLAELEKNYELQVTTAIGITATLSADPNTPIEVKSGPQVAGSLRSGDRTHTPLKFVVKIYDNATSEVYNLKLHLKYDYQKNVQINGNASNPDVSYWYDTLEQTQILKIKVKKQPRFKIKDNTELLAGVNQPLEVTIKNTGSQTAREVVAKISPQSPLHATVGTAYISALKPNETAIAKFKIEVDMDALSVNYSIPTVIQYKNPFGEIKNSELLQLEVPVIGKPEFEVINTEGSLRVGTEKIIKFTIKNTGNQIAKKAIAIISPLDPLSTTDDKAYLGDLKPKETKVATFKIKT
ncbi:MAG: COG1361 S-layer family protein, partial [Methanosarcinales archaeon]